MHLENLRSFVSHCRIMPLLNQLPDFFVFGSNKFIWLKTFALLHCPKASEPTLSLAKQVPLYSRRSEFDIALPLSDTLDFKFVNGVALDFLCGSASSRKWLRWRSAPRNFGFSVAESMCQIKKDRLNDFRRQF